LSMPPSPSLAEETQRSMFIVDQPLILASASPRRRRFLEELGLKFGVCPAEIDETPQPAEKPADYVVRLAREKAFQIGAIHQSAWVVSADTTVVVDDMILGKPDSEEQSVGMLMKLSGREHSVYTGYCLHCAEQAVVVAECCRTRVRFSAFTEDLAHAYARTGEAYDKAGGYGIQGKGGLLVQAIEGSYSNVVGLPLAEIISLLLQHRVIRVR